MFKTHKENIPQIHAVIDAFDECYFHGCGNLYDNKQDSDFRKDFTNPGHNNTTPASAYRVHFTSKRQVPETVEELNALLQKSFAKEQVEASKPKSVSNIKTVSVNKPAAETAPEAPADNSAPLPSIPTNPGIELTDEEQQAVQIAEEEAGKKKGSNTKK